MLKSACGYCFIPVRKILYFEANDKYARLFTIDGKETTVFHSLKELEKRLNCGDYIGSMIFFRIHRQYIAALHYATRWPERSKLMLNGDTELPVSRSCSDDIKKKLLAPYD